MDFRLPELGEGVYEAELVSWLVKPGDTVKRSQNLMEVLTDKATMEVPSPFAGTITALEAQPGQMMKVGDAVLGYTPLGQPDGTPVPENGNRKAEPKPEPATVLAAPTKVNRLVGSLTIPAMVKAAPSVRFLARKLGIDLARIRGSGPGGRILIEDLTPHLQPAATEAGQRPPEPRPDYGTPGTRLKLLGVRRKIAEHMLLAKRTIPHYSYVDECDVTELVRLRASLREAYAAAGIKLTYLAFFVKAVTGALKEVPMVNSSLDEESGEIVLHNHYHIGIAVAAPTGLIVPVIHDADRKDIGLLARDIERLSEEARTGRVRLEDLRGGTFTITSIGGVGGLISTPIINHPEVAILGVGKVVKRPTFDAVGKVRPADMLYLSLSFDHRVVDGAIGAAFGNAICRRLQNPATMLLPDDLATG
jgi:pyruvate dehydrogenase E2 component (dihydrolipoamide acetyltransferase)/2-oxoisovalerate dehydrogenase E2 component (dihydrolipoyl transacylase)